jgi:hypothetical protein
MVARDDTNKKCRVDQAWHKYKCCNKQRIHHSSAMVDPALRALIHPATVHTQIHRTRVSGKDRCNFSTGMPVEPLFMRLSGHAFAETKRHAVPGKARKCTAKFNDAGLFIRWRDERNRVAFVASIDSKIGAIHGDNAVFWIELAHADQAKIGEVGLAVTVALRQRGQLWQMIIAIKRQADKPILKHSHYQRGVLKMEGRFREHRLAGKQRLGNLCGQMQRPLVVGVTAINKRDQKPGIGDAFQAREKPLRLERFFGPFTLPARRINPWLAAVTRAFSSCSRTNLPFDTPDLAAVSSSQTASSSLTRIEIV